jgi:cytochrome c biogenesis protein CcmG/thiol:disulfide interchange protein DsbE
VILVIFLAIGLGHDPREVPSPLINKPAPAFQLAQLEDPTKTFSASEMRGKVWLLNVWASWCAACRDEHPMLLELSRSKAVPLYGLNYKDRREDGLAWLREFGNPYLLNATDIDGRVGIDYGVYGVPETYLIDREGVIRFKQIGPVTPEVVENKILPLVKELSK